MNVAFVSHDSKKGGAERALLELVEGLQQKGIRCFALLPSSGPLIAELQLRGVATAVFPYAWWCGDGVLWSRPLRDLASRHFRNATSLFPIVRRLKEWSVDAVVTNTSVIPVGALAALMLRKPHVWQIHEFGKEDHNLYFDVGFRLAAKLIGWLSTLVVANSHALANYYSPYVPLRKLRVIYQSVRVEAANGRKPNSSFDNREVELALVGSIQAGKGQIEAVKALGHLVDQGVRSRLLLVGPGGNDYAEQVKRTVFHQGLEKLVRFSGHVDDTTSVIEGSDIVLMCSRSEAFGRVTVEGMKLGKPVVGARAGATPELIRENFSGLLYAPGDCLDLAAKIRYLIEHPEEARRMGGNGKRWAEETFTIHNYVDAMEQALQQAVDIGPAL
jgi:glycosyltransferase involved in cell wall biosynthesis